MQPKLRYSVATWPDPVPPPNHSPVVDDISRLNATKISSSLNFLFYFI